MIEKYKNMLELQLKLNDDTNGPGWENDSTKEGKEINWQRCIYMESAELIASFDWKHWKQSKNDWANAKIELVDIFHFILSLMLREDKDIEAMAMKLDLLSAKFSLKDRQIASILELARELIHESSAKNSDINRLIQCFFSLCELVGLDLDELYKLYMGKNILNKFRQERGYKDGSYLKLWPGDDGVMEDNEVLAQLLDEGLNLGSLYRCLDERYINALHIKENKGY